jgi:hypothetical protein
VGKPIAVSWCDFSTIRVSRQYLGNLVTHDRNPETLSQAIARQSETFEIILTDRLLLSRSGPYATELRAHAKASGGLAEK